MAKLFYYLNKASFNGLMRFNSKGLFNTPRGRNDYHPEKNQKYFNTVYKLVKNWIIFNKDYSEIKPFDNECLIFADPPYVNISDMYYNKFNWNNQLKLIDYLSQFSNPII